MNTYFVPYFVPYFRAKRRTKRVLFYLSARTLRDVIVRRMWSTRRILRKNELPSQLSRSYFDGRMASLRFMLQFFPMRYELGKGIHIKAIPKLRRIFIQAAWASRREYIERRNALDTNKALYHEAARTEYVEVCRTMMKYV